MAISRIRCSFPDLVPAMAFKNDRPLEGGGRQEHISIQLDAVKAGNLACRVWQRGRG